MSLTNDVHEVLIGTTRVAVTGATGLVNATWTLLVDGIEVDRASAAGDFTLGGKLTDGTAVMACIHQSLLGPSDVTIVHEDDEVARFKGFVA